MTTRKMIIGQKVDRIKVQRAKELRCSMTPAEKILWEALRANRLHGLHFRRQQVIDGFIVDFYCHAAGLVVEVDGESHRQQASYDKERDSILTAQGLRVLRIENDEVLGDLARVLTRIAAMCCEACPVPSQTRLATENSTPPRAGEGPGER